MRMQVGGCRLTSGAGDGQVWTDEAGAADRLREHLGTKAWLAGVGSGGRRGPDPQLVLH